MTLLTFSLAAALASPPSDCSFRARALAEQRMFTNADLERLAACRYQTGAESEIGTVVRGAASREHPSRRASTAPAKPNPRELVDIALEAHWRAQWRANDQKARRLRREAHELRMEAGEAPKGPKKRPSGRRSPSILIGRARGLEAEAKEIEDEFQERARREGALPGWLRPKAR